MRRGSARLAGASSGAARRILSDAFWLTMISIWSTLAMWPSKN
jgi:hypothetical protein